MHWRIVQLQATECMTLNRRRLTEKLQTKETNILRNAVNTEVGRNTNYTHVRKKSRTHTFYGHISQRDRPAVSQGLVRRKESRKVGITHQDTQDRECLKKRTMVSRKNRSQEVAKCGAKKEVKNTKNKSEITVLKLNPNEEYSRNDVIRCYSKRNEITLG